MLLQVIDVTSSDALKLFFELITKVLTADGEIGCECTVGVEICVVCGKPSTNTGRTPLSNN